MKRVVVIAVVCLTGTLLVAGSTAEAAVGTRVFLGSFGSMGSGSGQFSGPAGVAVADATGDVYVVDRGNGRVEELDATGDTVLAEFNGAGAPAGPLLSPNAIAVDNSASLLDPSSGDVYVFDEANNTIDKFTAEGAYLTQLGETTAGTPLGPIDGIAVDSDGGLWVYQASGEIDNFSNAAVNEYVSLRFSPFGTGPGFGVDSEGNLYVARGNASVAKLNSLGEALIEEVGGEEDRGVTAIAVDEATNDLYISVGEAGIVRSFDGSGEPLESFGAGQLTGGAGVAIDSQSADVYVSDAVADTVNIFGPPPPLAPRVQSEWSSEVASGSARLNARVDPRFFDATYHFQYGKVSCTADPGACSEVPRGAGIDLGNGSGVRLAQTVLGGLEPATTYYYRVVAVNSNGAVYGSDRKLTTFPAAGSEPVLPDDRAWEMVSPLEKNGGQIVGINRISSGGVAQASLDGEAVTYLSATAFADPRSAPLGNQYLSRRGSGGWSVANISPPINSYTYGVVGKGTPYKGFSPDLSTGLLLSGEPRLGGGYPSVGNPPLAPGAPPGYENYYLRDNEGGSFEALLREKPEVSAELFEPELVGASADMRHIVIATRAALTSGAVEGGLGEYNLYELAGGRVAPVNVMPGAGRATSPAPNVELGGGAGLNVLEAISTDGSRVFWSSHGSLYVRENGTTTTEVDKSKEGSGPSGGGEFWGASSDGSEVVFTDGSRLTPDATAGDGLRELYELDLNTGGLVDLSVDQHTREGSADPDGADVRGVLGVSADGTYVYYVARGVLADRNGEGQAPLSGGENLYVSHGDVTSFIATLGSDDSNDWAAGPVSRTARVTPDGSHVSFMSDLSLTGYDNADAASEAPDQEVYLYDAATQRLVCASCDPSGARPLGASSIPGATAFENNHALYQSRVLSEDGSRLFFESQDALVPDDTNGRQDVYEYEDGRAALISSGSGSEDASFVDASANGDDVFFITGQQLVGQDTDQSADLYDARAPHTPGETVGFAAPPVPVAPCVGESCKAPLAPAPVFGSGATGAVGSSGNLAAPALVTKAKKTVKVEKTKKAKKPRKGKKRKKPKPKGAPGKPPSKHRARGGARR